MSQSQYEQVAEALDWSLTTDPDQVDAVAEWAARVEKALTKTEDQLDTARKLLGKGLSLYGKDNSISGKALWTRVRSFLMDTGGIE